MECLDWWLCLKDNLPSLSSASALCLGTPPVEVMFVPTTDDVLDHVLAVYRCALATLLPDSSPPANPSQSSKSLYGGMHARVGAWPS